MKVMIRCLMFAVQLLCLSGISNLASAEETNRYNAAALPGETDADGMDQVDFYLHTVDVGHMIWDNFGHAAIRVVDHRNHSDLVYNWGQFEFSNPITFAVDFYRGFLYYKLGVYPNAVAMRIYRWENRSVWEDKLLLKPQEKAKLLAKLNWNNRPENQYYLYQYFFDNCSTRPRDYIDEAIGGVLRERYSKVLSSKTFRDFVMEGYAPNPGMDVLLDFGMNSNIDRFATLYETMFHPINARQVLLDYTQEVRPLLSEGHKLVDAERPNSYPKMGYSFILLFGGVPLIPFGFWLFFQQKKAVPSKALYRLFGAFSSVWLGLGGFFGFLMALSWGFSGHLDLHHNANMLLFWPIDGFAFAIAFGIFLKGQPLVLKPGFWTFARAYFLLHIVVSILLPCLRMVGVIAQNVDSVSVFLLPPYVVILFLLFRVGFRKS
ncbi:MAG: DUF4105 domain-containing protein [Chitinophagaceae bacterium]|nr:DUF4105 domain-containing protein [Oligoflexus sp.]